MLPSLLIQNVSLIFLRWMSFLLISSRHITSTHIHTHYTLVSVVGRYVFFSAWPYHVGGGGRYVVPIPMMSAAVAEMLYLSLWCRRWQQTWLCLLCLYLWCRRQCMSSCYRATVVVLYVSLSPSDVGGSCIDTILHQITTLTCILPLQGQFG